MNETKNILLKLFILLTCGVGWSSQMFAQGSSHEWFTWSNSESYYSVQENLTENTSAIRTGNAYLYGNFSNYTVRPTSPTGYWALVPVNEANKVYNIINAYYGEDYVLGCEWNSGSQGQSSHWKMYPKTQANGVGNVYTEFIVDNSARSGVTYGQRAQKEAQGRKYIKLNAGFDAFMWAPAGDGNWRCYIQAHAERSFMDFQPVGGDIAATIQQYWADTKIGRVSNNTGLSQVARVGYETSTPLNINQYAAVNSYLRAPLPGTVSYKLIDGSGNQITTQTGYIPQVNVNEGTASVYLDEAEKDEWTINITGDDTGNCKLLYNGIEYQNTVSIGKHAKVSAMSFMLSGADNKFVWGPVLDYKAKTVTYDVRERAADLTTGWYQLQVADANAANLSGKIKTEEGNINTAANTLYLAPAIYEPGGNKIFKVTGVPQYADEAATYVRIEKNGDNYAFVHPSTGASITAGGFTFANGLLTKSSGWSFEATAHPLEGPYLLNSGNENMAFNVSPMPVDNYDIYQVNITGSGSLSDVRLNIHNTSAVGNTTVANGGYIFLAKGAAVPLRGQFSVKAGNVTVESLAIGNPVDGVTPITITVAPRQSLWTIHITGAAKQADDRVTYNNAGSYEDGDMVGVTFGIVPSALDFKTNVTDRFVWGPIINENNNTVTFEVRTTAEELAAGKWYQMVLRDKEGQVILSNNVVNKSSIVEGINELPTLRKQSNYIYPITAGVTDYPVELTGTTGADMEAQTYVYISKASAGGVTMMMQNGKYVKSDGGGSDNVNENIPLVYESTTHTYKWNSKALPWDNLRNSRVGIGLTSRANEANMEYFMTQAPVKAYKVVLPNGTGTLVYNGETALIGSNRAASGYFIFAAEGANLEGEAESNIDISKFSLSGAEGTITSITASTDGGITTLTVATTAPTYDHEIIHKQNRYYDHLETDPNKPTDGFIQDGEGWSVRTGAGDKVIREQNTSVFEIPVYLKQGTSIESYLPTNQLNSYQRWYNWDTDGQVDATVLTSTRNARSKQTKDLNTYTKYNNGYVVFRGANNTDNDAYVPVLSLPSPMEEYNVGLDISRMTDETQNVANTNNSAIEPTLGMRIVYQVRDAKQIATKIKTASDGGDFFEVHDISLPNVQYGSRADRLQDRTLSTTLPLDMDLNNYWGFNSGGTGNDNLVQLTQDSQLRIELVDGGSNIKNYMMIPGSANANSGNISRTSFNTGHFVLFQYPDNGYIEPNSTAKINVYMTSGDREYKLVQFNLTFISNAHPLVVTELKDSYRHPDALAEAFGAPVTELTFDQTPNTEYSTTEGGVSYPDYRYPIDYKGASYAFGVRNGRNWASSRGEYALQSVAGSSGQTGTPRMVYYPVVNYLKSMKDPSVAFGSKEEGAYELYIDAADQPGKIASIELKDALCAGSRLYCYGYIGCTSGGTTQHPTSVLINVMGIDKDTNKEKLIYSYCPGIITLRGYAEDGRTIYSTMMGNSSSYSQRSGNEDRNYWAPWQQIGFSFAISAEIASQMKGYTIQIMNNAYNSNGGDTMLDDFQIYVKKPGAEVQNTTPLCSDQIRHIKVITEYNTLIEATGEDTNHDGLMNVGFCFLDKETYDKTLAANADKDAEHGYPRNDPNNKYNVAFGAALMGNRTLDRTNKDHAFHNFDIIRDGAVSNIYGETKEHFYTDIPQYSFKESSDDVVYRDSIRGERYIVFKESVAHGEPSSLTTHKWTAGKSYYLLFSTANISETHVNNHDLGCTVFNLDDNKCAVMSEFTVAPPVSIKGDAEQILSGDLVQACEGQTPTLSVNLNGRTETKDVVIKNLTYDWWLGYTSHKPMELENGVPKYYDSNGHAVYTGDPDVTYNTLPATLQNYMNVWWGKYSKAHTHLDKNVGDRIYLSDAMVEFRRAYPNATSLVGVVPKHVIGDTEEYELTQEMIDCIAHFLIPEAESGITPLVLAKKELNIALNAEKADEEHIVHFVVIPIAPGIYSVDEDAIYCPDPQELKILLQSKAPALLDGFNTMTYPESMDNVPLRLGLQHLNAARSGKDEVLRVPVRKVDIALPETGRQLVKLPYENAPIYLVGTDDPAYRDVIAGDQTGLGSNLIPSEDDNEEMVREIGMLKSLRVKAADQSPTMDIVFLPNARFREGFTYSIKVPFIEVDEFDVRNLACTGSFVFDMKVVPEYQVWTGATGNTDWTNDKNWARADRGALLAGKTATGDIIADATPLDDATSYPANADNETAGSFVPMYFTNVLFNNPGVKASVLYDVTPATSPLDANPHFLQNLNEATATPNIIYDMEVAAEKDGKAIVCEPYGTYIAKGVTFEPATMLYNAHLLSYQKAWVEYELDAGRWYTVGSPLKKSVAGDWYSPTAGGKQLTPHFYDINYSETLNDRYRPAYYQRSWDRNGNNVVYTKAGGTYDSYVRADWSNVYNDATVNYNAGGFSVKAELDYMDPADRPADGKVLVRLPKADTSYTYYDVAGETGSAADANIGLRNESYRLLSDDLGADGAGSITMSVSNNTIDNNFLLLSNPFMATMDMDKFFAANTDLEEKYWIVDADHQMVSLKSADSGEWITTSDAGGKYVAPLQGFFVKKKDAALNPGSINASYTAAMQTVVNPGVSLRAPASRSAVADIDVIRLVAERNGAESTALIVLNENAHDGYVVGEDCETFLDGNLETKPNVYTAAAATAQSINVRKTLDMVPVGIISTDDSPAVLRFDLSDSSHTILYLYDSETESYTTVNDGTEVTMPGNNAGRYFIVSEIRTILDDDATEVSEAVELYNLHGIRVATSQRGTVTIRGSRKEFRR